MTTLPANISRSDEKYYAIELKETRFKHFRDQNDTTEITFTWDEIVKQVNQTKNKLTIQVAQNNPNSLPEEVNSLVQAVFETKNIRELDRVFGIQDQRIDKIGYVTGKKIAGPSVKLDVNWIRESSLEEIAIPVFRDNEQIQHLKANDLHTIKEHYGDLIEVLYDRMPFVKNEWQQHYTIERNENVDQLLPKREPGGKVRLFYGTNRKPTDLKNGIQKYGNEEDELQQGICEVNIPMGHVPGAMERPNDFWIVKFLENEDMHIMLQSAMPLDKETFIEHFNGTLNNTKGKDALLFVHGYNCSFEDAARRTAQLAYDLPFKGFSGFFSWASNAKIPHYFADEATARSASPSLAKFLEHFILDTELEQLHIIAHSMGSLVTTLSLNQLRNTGTLSAHLDKIQQLILGAPDIDQQEFRNTILPTFRNIGKRRTIYASDHDIALWASSLTRANRIRLGQVGKDLFLDLDVETIEASNLKNVSPHSYLFESKQLLTDLFYLIAKDLNPADRRLREINSNILPYWLFLE